MKIDMNPSVHCIIVYNSQDMEATEMSRGMGKGAVVRVCYGILFSHYKGTVPLAATRVDFRRVILNEVSQPEKEKYCMTSLVCGILKAVIQLNLSIK